MKSDDNIKKWVNEGKIPDEDRVFFQQLESSLRSMKAPSRNIEEDYARLRSVQNQAPAFTSRVIPLYPRMAFAAAASIALILTVYFLFFQPSEKVFETGIAETLELYLPDSSLVILNSNSRLSYDINSWNENRDVMLAGEAFFDVRKGSKFSVIGEQWEVNVLGTRFNIIDREGVLSVKCFEGKVAVASGAFKEELSAGNEFRIIDGGSHSRNFVTDQEQPSWIEGDLEYESMPIEFIIEEMERNFGIEINAERLNTSRDFTGTISRHDLQSALKTLSLSTGCSFEIIGQNIVQLHCEDL